MRHDIAYNTTLIKNESEEIPKIDIEIPKHEFKDIQDPVFVLFGNAAYKSLLANYICNIAVFPGMHEHTLIIVTDLETKLYLEGLSTQVNIWLIEDSDQDAYNYDTAQYIRLMQLRGQHLLQVLGKKTILWLEADAMYYENLLLQPEILHSSTDITFFWDWQSYGGGFIRFAATDTARQFYADIINTTGNGVNDQSSLNQYIASSNFKNFSVFNDCKYRSGMYYKNEEYRRRCEGVKAVVQQYNWIVGVQSKISLAKEKNQWYLTADERQCRQRDLRIIVMTMNRPASLLRLMNSIKHAKYPQDVWSVDLQVNVDRDAQGLVDTNTIHTLADFKWDMGFFGVRVWDKQMGLLGQWLEAWPCELFSPTLYKAVILLEDDLEVSPFFALWFLGAHQVYKAADIGAVTGMRPQLVAKSGLESTMEELIPEGVKAFAYKLIATWSLSPTYDNWKRFREWYYTRPSNFIPTVEGIKPNEWYRDFHATGNTARMWEMWYIRFTDEYNYYTLYPWMKDKTVVCNWKERGMNYDGSENTQPDYPLVLSEEIVNGSLTQDPLPRVEWDLSFYLCLTGDLYGQLGNQLLTLAWAQKLALQSSKFLRLSSFSTPNLSRLYLKENWDQIFDTQAFPYILMDGQSDIKCHQSFTYESIFFEQLNQEFTIPLPKSSVQEHARKAWDSKGISVHGRSFEGTCALIKSNHCPSRNENVENLCDYSSHRLRHLFSIDSLTPMVLFSDKQDTTMDSTYEIINEDPIAVQLWMQVISETHIGNPMSTLDLIVYHWKKQTGLGGRMLPESCYASVVGMT